MKYISFAIPCYNSQDYMEKCVESILVGGDDIEIIIVNDGSKDNTAAIADRLAAEHPGIIRVVHQENAGHGGAVNAGLDAAEGLYFKVVDSDDKVDTKAYKTLLNAIKEQVAKNAEVDMFISNYVYDKVGERHKTVMKYGNLPKDTVFGWDDIVPFKKGRYILMHSVIYRTQMLKDCGLKLPKHTFYVDNIYVFAPLPYVKKMYYCDVDFYMYYIGREDQSVNEQTMIKRIDQQIRVNKLMFGYFDYKGIKSKNLRNYMYNYLEIITVVTTVLLAKSGTPQNLDKRKNFWNEVKVYDVALYRKLRHGFLCGYTNLPTKLGRLVSIVGYKAAQKIVGFN